MLPPFKMKLQVNQIYKGYSSTIYVRRVINAHIIYLTILMTAKVIIDILNCDLFNLCSPLLLNHFIFHPGKILTLHVNKKNLKTSW